MKVDLIRIQTIGERPLVSVSTPHGQFAIAQVEGSFYVFPDSCSHASCPLSDGTLSGSVLTCECHFSEFDVTTGRVLTEPAEVDLVVTQLIPQGEMLCVEDETLVSMRGV